MPDLSRRALFGASAATALFAAVPLARAEGATITSPVWDLTDLYPTDAAWLAEHDRMAVELPKLLAFKGTTGQSAAALQAALQAISDADKAVSRLSIYASLKGDVDTRSAPDQERRSLARNLGTTLGQASAWLAPEVLGLGADKAHAFEAADPGLGKFRFQLDQILRAAPHTLSDSDEAILAATGTVLGGPRNVYIQLTGSDIPWPEITLTTGKVKLDDQGYGRYRQSPNRDDRRKVFTTFFGAYGEFESSLGATLAAKINGDVFTARTRKFDSSMQAALFENGVPEGVYRTLIAEANAGLPQLHRYFKVRQKLLGLPDMAYYDIYPPVVKLGRTFDLDTKRRLALEAMKPLGQPYVDKLAKATAAKWMDALPKPGKTSGAYMNGGAYDVHPYLLLNLYDDYDGLTTFAHEWGHAMHSVLANAAQPYETAEYTIFLAEIASTNNEQLLAHYMEANATTKDEKLFYLVQLLELLRGTFFRQTMFAEFELLSHEEAEKGAALSGHKFSAIYLDLLKRYHGPNVIIDPTFAVEWAYIPHFYRNFYVYQYATCVAASAFFSDRTLAGGAAERESYLNVLRTGGSDYPNDILKRAGLDMTSPAPYRALIAKFARTLDQVEALMG